MDVPISPQNLDTFAAMAWAWSVAFLPRLALAAIILGVGLIAARWAGRLVGSILDRTGHVDETVRPVLASVVRYAVLILVAVAALGQVGVQTASLLAVLGAAGLAIGLALQGTLTNIAAGIMLLWLRPFRIGDFIEVQGGNVSGIVRETGLFSCELETYDGIAIFAPNSTIWNYALKNHTRNRGRLVSFNVKVPRDADIDRARAILTRMLRDDRRILDEPAPDVFVDTYAADAVLLTCRIWADQAQVGEVQRSVIEGARHALEGAGEGELKPREIIRTIPPDADPSRLVFFDKRLRRAGAR